MESPDTHAVRLLLILAVFAVAARADRIDDILRIHREALGGADRLGALAAMRATGSVVAGGRRVQFTLIAARPDRLRLETGATTRTLVQATDGENPPWEFDTGVWPPHYRDLPAASAGAFVLDAEYDDPLIAGDARGFTCEFAGETEGDDRHLLRVLVTWKLKTTFTLLLDADTYLIVLRDETRTSAAGRPRHIITHYDDYRPVDGVLLPHRITTTAEGQAPQQTLIDAIQPNPDLTAETFARPKVTLPKR